jgi:hypothetical protein
MADASEIREHMEVIASDGEHVGIVDRMEGPDTIKLARQSGGHGHHHLIPLSWVDHVDAHVHLDKPANYVAQNWQHGH